MLYLDALQTFWRERVIEYDANQQVALGAQAIYTTRSSFFRMQRWIMHSYAKLLRDARHAQIEAGGAAGRWFLEAGMAVLVIPVLLYGPRLWLSLARARLAKNPERAPRAAAELWYDRMIHSCARKGWRKLPTQTPSEFAGRIETELVRERVGCFTQHYEWARFGDSADDARMLPEIYESLMKAMHR
jgi:Domain of unknown function (DUF4129)